MLRGGSIGYMSSDATQGKNIVNCADMGREIQLSYYSGPNFYNPPTEEYPDGACDKVSDSPPTFALLLLYFYSTFTPFSLHFPCTCQLFGHPGVPWAWNPIGAGDIDGNHGQILSFTKTASSWHIATRPLQWACHNVSCDCTFEQWLVSDRQPSPQLDVERERVLQIHPSLDP